jgi:hypothetical protein
VHLNHKIYRVSHSCNYLLVFLIFFFSTNFGAFCCCFSFIVWIWSTNIFVYLLTTFIWKYDSLLFGGTAIYWLITSKILHSLVFCVFGFGIQGAFACSLTFCVTFVSILFGSMCLLQVQNHMESEFESSINGGPAHFKHCWSWRIWRQIPEW